MNDDIAQVRADGDWPAVFSLPRVYPGPWTPVDSLLWGKTMGLWLSLNWRTELSRQALGQYSDQRIREVEEAFGLYSPSH